MGCLDYIGERRTGINQSVTEDVASVFKGKTMSQLKILDDQIRKKLRGGEGVDVGKCNVSHFFHALNLNAKRL